MIKLNETKKKYYTSYYFNIINSDFIFAIKIYKFRYI